MVLEHYISELLYRYSCVMVPEFGAFLTQMKSAVVEENSNAFFPPTKVVSFNEQVLSNDGLLVSYISEAEKTSYEDMLKMVADTVSTWKSELQKGNKLVLANIGELSLNAENKIQFQPENQINYLTSSFGLSSFVAPPISREVLKEEVAAMEERIPFIITPEKREKSSFRPYLKYAAIFLLAISTGLTGFRIYDQSLNNQQLAEEDAREQVTKHIQEATFFDASPIELPAISLNVGSITKKETVRTHHIIAGAFRFRKNSDKKITLLKRRGYDAAYLGTNAFGLHMVTYGSYTDVDEALRSLRAVKRTQSKDAWLLSKN